MLDRVRIALPKGRIFTQALDMLRPMGIELTEDPEVSRKLIWPTTDPSIEVVRVRSVDVPTFVEHGAADLGIAGKDVIVEHGAEGFYEPLDLEIAKCRFSVCGYAGTDSTRRNLKVATKFKKVALDFFAARRQPVEIIKLNGALELAPIVGLADVIVDIVETGSTLKANGLVELEPVGEISSRIIVNRASSKLKHQRIRPMLDALKKQIR
ncbi:MAG: ATP phosphoribosyltransferase [Gammaproteobacteria bacterium]|nr:ATP phosphoribosyltransferase [Gammaproteobacteria bacterium]